MKAPATRVGAAAPTWALTASRVYQGPPAAAPPSFGGNRRMILHYQNALPAALDYLRRGFVPIPIAPGTKKPPKGFSWKTYQKNKPSPDEVGDWYGRWPDAGVAILTGKISGLVVLDEDRPGALDELSEQIGMLPETARSNTGKGTHLYFSYSGNGVRNSVNSIAEGIDVRGEGGYVVAPPSIHPDGKTYTWAESLDYLSPLPEPVREIIFGVPIGQTNRVNKPRATKPRIIGEGSRNNTLTSIAGRLRRAGAEENAIEVQLSETNNRWCVPPLPSAEIKGIARSVSRYDSLQETTDIHWYEPRELPPETPPVPHLPNELIPGSLRPYLADAANRASVPIEMVAIPTVVILSSIVGRTVGICPEHNDDWTVIPNLWGAIVAPPGMMKSHCINVGRRLLSPLMDQAHREFEEAQADAEVDKARLELELKSLTSGKRSTSSDPTRIAEVRRELKENDPAERRYLTSDTTAEKLGEILVRNSRGILLLRDEIAGWLSTLGRAGREGEREFFLEAWSGDSAFYVDRIKRGSIRIPHVCASIVGSIQPGKLRRYIYEAIAQNSGADGLLQRFQLVVWPDEFGQFQRVNKQPDNPALDRAMDVFSVLDTFNPSSIGAVQNRFNEVQCVRWAPEAQLFFDEWRSILERRIRGRDHTEHPAYEAHIGKYRSLMPSLALIFELSEWADSSVGFVSGVSLQSAQKAAAWVKFLDAHARKIYSVELDPAPRYAHAIAEKIRSGEIYSGMTVRDIYRGGWGGLRNRSAVLAGLETLESIGWICIRSSDTGGRPTKLVYIHPSIQEESK